MKIFYVFVGIFLVSNIKIQGQSNLDTPQIIEQNIQWSREYLQKDIDSALFFSNQAQKLSQSIKNDTLIAKSYLQKSSVLILKKQFAKADSLLRNNLNKTLPKHIEGQTWHNIGTILYYKQAYADALSMYLKAAKILEQTNDTKQLVNTYSNIGAINATLKNFKNAQLYLERALSISDFNEILKLQILVNLSTIYTEQKLYKKYIDNTKVAEELALKYNSKHVLAVIYNNLSTHYSNENANEDLAINYGKKAIALKKELNQTNNLSVSYNNIAHCYLKKKEHNMALKYLDSALPGSQGLLRAYIYNNLKEAHVGLHEYKKAIHYADIMNKVKDSITDAKQKEKVTELTEQFESEKKQQQINVLDAQKEIQALTIKQQNYILGILSVFVILLAILGYFWFKNYKTKQQLNTLLLQQKLRKTQLNPHFLFNALQSIQNFIYKNNKEKSSSYLASYSKLIRLVLEKSDDNFTTIADDRIALESYLRLQQLNHDNSFTYFIDIDPTVSEDFDILPNLITQPFVENAVLHGLKNNPDGIIAVKYYKKNNALYVTIKDNGKGYEVNTSNSNRLHTSMSMSIIKEQLKNLNKSSKGFTGEISTDSSSTGTTVMLTFTNT
ncbi:tetratricopeptide repeat-containing sensor histidine kinase [Aquimarina pacifica]|uniref:tetratricopeptide repeat-containing sensor histidine kinase n=1 Tax=Aquimarina pacifica TaxID=1296415 RepID=UPI00046F978A|nr:tetratricopeptide repeat protein [Aquimarina pacifica]